LFIPTLPALSTYSF
jgi:hypothetical protein